MATLKRTVRSKSRSTKTLPYRAAKKPRSTTTRQPKKATAKPYEPEPLTFRDMVHDAIAGLEEARRSFDDMRVFTFRGNHDLAHFEDIIFHESLKRVHNWLVRLDIEMPEGGAS
ncbi:MAG TPA: hypothetical protein VH062_10185 [Polyangiaceae bacterium]|jgi:hypothetical protein|nr:hypothetical protein [Polyangiaceae bacterium]